MSGYEISLDKARLQLEVIHGFLAESYWAKGIPKETVARAIEGSLCVGAYAGDGRQVGFARLITDMATFGYLADVFVVPEHRGQGLSVAMVKAFLDLPEVQGMRRLSLVTRDAHGVYARLGFTPLANPGGYMELHRRDVYASGS
ncbi:MAG TPA: GNAT family N-acetyltransferase [Holophagaceae bacterium]|nr:GNAT family N-acetyltransferase [Holophagaceae bacterium]